MTESVLILIFGLIILSQIALQITQKMAVESMEQEELCAQVNPEIMSHHSKLIYSILS